MSQPGKNVRLRRTQKLLREALIALIEERGFDALTIGELTERAMVSRAAFYRNYQDKYDLVNQYLRQNWSRTKAAFVVPLGRSSSQRRNHKSHGCYSTILALSPV